MTPNEEKKSIVDPRVTRTRRLLWEALIALMGERPYALISVQDIAQRSNVNRATFYKHFENKDDLFIQGFRDRLAPIIDKVNREWTRQDANDPEGFLAHIVFIFTEINEERAIFRRLVRSGEDEKLLSLVIDLIYDTLLKNRMESLWPKLIKEDTDIPQEKWAKVISAMFLGLVTWWVYSDSEVSAAEVARIYARLFSRGILG
jgi:AcrR family transcriptional regulator